MLKGSQIKNIVALGYGCLIGFVVKHSCLVIVSLIVYLPLKSESAYVSGLGVYLRWLLCCGVC